MALLFQVIQSQAVKHKISSFGFANVDSKRLWWGAAAGPNVLIAVDTDGGLEPSITTLHFATDADAIKWIHENKL